MKDVRDNDRDGGIMQSANDGDVPRLSGHGDEKGVAERQAGTTPDDSPGPIDAADKDEPPEGGYGW